MDNNKIIIFVRHGESTENAAKKQGIVYDKNNIVLTENGQVQAKTTGKYLYDTFGKFDKLYTSYATRCIQTTEIIKSEIKHNKNHKIDDLLIEVGYKSNKLDGLNKEERKKIFDNIKLTLPKDSIFDGIKTFRQLDEKLNKTVNPFDRLKILKTWPDIEKKHLDIKPNSTQVTNNYKKFLKKLKDTRDRTILVISHGNCIENLQSMLCNIDMMNDNVIIQARKDNDVDNERFGNCCVICLELSNGKYSLVSPASINHLKVS